MTTPQPHILSCMTSSLARQGYVLRERGYFAEAAAALQKAFALDPTDGLVIDTLVSVSTDWAGLLQAEGRRAEAEALQRKCQFLKPGTGGLAPDELPRDGAAARALAVDLYQQAIAKIFETPLILEALNAMRRARALCPTEDQIKEGLAVALYQLAVPLYNVRAFAEAETHLWEALSLRPDFPEARRLIEFCAQHPARHSVDLTAARYQPAALELWELLKVEDVVDGRYVRVGKDADGGYIMLDHGLDNVVAYSLGISDDVSWDLAMALRGCTIFQFDHTIDRLPAEHPNFHWSKLGISGRSDPGGVFRTLEELIAANGHEDRDDLILKIDIEGAEWGVFDALADEILCQFSQIVGEFHGLPTVADPRRRAILSRALGKLNRHFQLVHLHPNNGSLPAFVGGVPVFNDVELTFVRRRDHRFESTKRLFPTALDRPCCPEVAEFAFNGVTWR